MLKYFYELEYVLFSRFDETDQENVEDRHFVGYFSSTKKVNEAIKSCLGYDDIIEKNFQIKKYKINIEKPISKLYSLYHEYAIITEDNDYIDYSYSFPPKATKKEIEELYNLMKKKRKYKKQEGRDYTIYPPDGFLISIIEIDQIFFNGLY